MTEFAEHRPHHHIEQPKTARGDSARSAPSFQPGLPSGTGLGKYRVLERIRTQHNAIVYKARDLMLDRLVVLKQMLPGLMDSPTACGNFKKEAQLLARVPKDARHILNVHELIEDEAGLFIVEEYVDGDWLESLIAKRRIGVGEAYRLLKTTALGLRDLHARHIVHRDINPRNIMIARGTMAKLANFSSAAHEGDLGRPPVSTPKYAAPELLLDKSYDDRVDLYSLGMVLYEVAVGRGCLERFFEPILRSPMPIAGWMRWHMDLARRLPDPVKLNPAVPPALSSIIQQMTAKRLKERYTCIEEVLAAVSRHARTVDRPDAPKPAVPWAFMPGRAAGPWNAPESAGEQIGRQAQIASAQRLHVQTTMQTVRPAARRAAPTQRPMPSVGPARMRLGRRRPASTRRLRPAQIGARMPTVPAPILPRASKKPARRRKHPVLKQAMAAIVLIALGASIYFTIDHYVQYVPPHPIQGAVAAGISAFEHDDLNAARRQFTDAANMVVHHREHQRLRSEAENWVLMVDAKEALSRDDFTKAQRILRDVERRGGVNTAKIDEIQRKIWAKQDAYKLAADGYDKLKAGQFGAVELNLDEYQKTAAAAGLDPGAMKDKLDSSRRQHEYEEYLKMGEEALARGEYDKANTACFSAEKYLISSATRDLRKRIGDMQKQSEFEAQGDRAVLNEEYSDAVQHYEQANSVKPTPEIEKKVRQARAHLLLRQANESIAKGDLLLAEDKLNSSIWNHQLYEAQVKLEKLRPALDAARQIRAGDRALEIENFDEAVRIYEEALPRLPNEAAQQVKRKIEEAKRRQLVDKGRKAFDREDWSGAIDSLEEAQKLNFDPAIQEMLVRAKAKSP